MLWIKTNFKTCIGQNFRTCEPVTYVLLAHVNNTVWGLQWVIKRNNFNKSNIIQEFAEHEQGRVTMHVLMSDYFTFIKPITAKCCCRWNGVTI